MEICWQFVEGYENESSHWSWCVLNASGAQQNSSPRFDTYGLAVSDAIKHGFQPRLHHWMVTTRHTVTHFRPGKPPLTLPAADATGAMKGKPERASKRGEPS